MQNKTRAYKEAQNEHQTSLVTVKLTVLKSTPSKEAYSAVTAALDFSSVRVEPPSLMQEKATLSEQGRQPRGFLLVIQDKDDTLLVVPKLHCSNDLHGVKETKLNSLPNGLFSKTFEKNARGPMRNSETPQSSISKRFQNHC